MEFLGQKTQKTLKFRGKNKKFRTKSTKISNKNRNIFEQKMPKNFFLQQKKCYQHCVNW
jgi:hypothetical protein